MISRLHVGVFQTPVATQVVPEARQMSRISLPAYFDELANQLGLTSMNNTIVAPDAAIAI